MKSNDEVIYCVSESPTYRATVLRAGRINLNEKTRTGRLPGVLKIQLAETGHSRFRSRILVRDFSASVSN